MFFCPASMQPAQLHLMFGKLNEFPLLSLFSIMKIIPEAFKQEWTQPNTHKPCLFLPSGSLLICLITQLKVKVKSCLTLCYPVDCSLPGSSVHGIPQTRVLEWVAISFSRGSSRPRDRTWVSHIAGRRFTL